LLLAAGAIRAGLDDSRQHAPQEIDLGLRRPRTA
jgi:hypothetical protein